MLALLKDREDAEGRAELVGWINRLRAQDSGAGVGRRNASYMLDYLLGVLFPLAQQSSEGMDDAVSDDSPKTTNMVRAREIWDEVQRVGHRTDILIRRFGWGVAASVAPSM